MAIWQIQTEIAYKSLGYDDEYDARYILLYRRGELSEWNPVYAGYDTDVYNDTDEMHKRIPSFPGLSSHITCDERSRSILDELIHDHVNFLPLASHTITDEQYYILYPKTILGCLDNEEPGFSRLQPGRFEGIRRHVFKSHCSDCIGNIPIFKLPTSAFGSPSGQPYVNDNFKQLVEHKNLTGLIFSKVWEG